MYNCCACCFSGFVSWFRFPSLFLNCVITLCRLPNCSPHCIFRFRIVVCVFMDFLPCCVCLNVWLFDSLRTHDHVSGCWVRSFALRALLFSPLWSSAPDVLCFGDISWRRLQVVVAHGRFSFPGVHTLELIVIVRSVGVFLFRQVRFYYKIAFSWVAPMYSSHVSVDMWHHFVVLVWCGYIALVLSPMVLVLLD